MTEPLLSPAANAPWACPTKLSCMAHEASLKVRTTERDVGIIKLAEALDTIAALEAQLAVKMSTVELAKTQERIASYQAIDIAQRRDLDRLAEENFQLRQIMRTNKIDFEAVDAILAPVMARHDRQSLLDVQT